MTIAVRWMAVIALAFAAVALADAWPAYAGLGQPVDGQMNLQDAATPVMEGIRWFHDVVTIVITLITIFVLVLLLIVIFRFNERANPTPSKTTHNAVVEVLWTVVPVLILLVIAIPSFRLLYLQYSYPKPDLTIKAVGNSWFWEHQFPDQGGFKVTSNILRDEDVLKGELGQAEFDKRYGKLMGVARSKQLYADAKPFWAKNKLARQLSVDNEIAVPVNKVVHVLVTSNDVIHNWTIPSFGSKVDAVPGRMTATWFKATKKGMYYGQCSELCGKDHAYMPIAIRVVDEGVFNNWVAAAKARDWKKAKSVLAAADLTNGNPKVASATQAEQK